MSILTGNEILKQVRAGAILIDPFDEARLQPNSVDLTLAPELLVYAQFPLDANKDNRTQSLVMPADGFVLRPRRLYLGSIVERVGSRKYVADVDGVSSIARLGIAIHLTAGLGELGFLWTWCLEITVVHPVRVYPRMRIAQARFNTVEGDTSRQYSGKYVNQQGPTASRSYQDSQTKE